MDPSLYYLHRTGSCAVPNLTGGWSSPGGNGAGPELGAGGLLAFFGFWYLESAVILLLAALNVYLRGTWATGTDFGIVAVSFAGLLTGNPFLLALPGSLLVPRLGQALSFGLYSAPAFGFPGLWNNAPVSLSVPLLGSLVQSVVAETTGGSGDFLTSTSPMPLAISDSNSTHISWFVGGQADWLFDPGLAGVLLTGLAGLVPGICYHLCTKYFPSQQGDKRHPKLRCYLNVSDIMLVVIFRVFLLVGTAGRWTAVWWSGAIWITLRRFSYHGPPPICYGTSVALMFGILQFLLIERHVAGFAVVLGIASVIGYFWRPFGRRLDAYSAKIGGVRVGAMIRGRPAGLRGEDVMGRITHTCLTSR